ncbi:hypothetical protein ACEXQD_12265 [Herbiconiux sp. P15]|uniref:hypothetical protein n=1 Tax=Herbiconiux liukaitaii TaxID=3342799 RepID=UPI0035B726AB
MTQTSAQTMHQVPGRDLAEAEAAETDLSVPIASTAQLARAVGDLVGAAIRDQVWLVFLDARQRVMPLLLPAEGFRLGDPLDDGKVRTLAELAGEVSGTIDAKEVVVVWERIGGRRLTVGERGVVDRLAAHFPRGAVALRAQYLCHSLGVVTL